MKTLKDIISEKLTITDKSKINSYSNNKLSQSEQDKILDGLCLYFQQKGYYKNKLYDNRLEVVDKIFNSDIVKYFNTYNMWEDIYCYVMNNYGKIKLDDLMDFNSYVKNNKEYLYNEIKGFVL